MKARIEKLEKELAELKAEYNTDYPIVCKDVRSELIVKFTELKTGEVLVGNHSWDVGDISNSWVPHTAKGEWKQIPYDKERDLYDKQVVYCEDDSFPCQVVIRFYDAINKCSFYYGGTRDGFSLDHYEAVPQAHIPQRMLDAYKILED